MARRLHQHYGLETEISNSLYDALTAMPACCRTPVRVISTSLLNQQILPVLSQQLLAQRGRAS
ncbi:hypothetical protein AB2I11_15145 [Escherichia coli]